MSYIRKCFRAQVDSFSFNAISSEELKYAYMKLGLFNFILFLIIYIITSNPIDKQEKKVEQNLKQNKKIQKINAVLSSDLSHNQKVKKIYKIQRSVDRKKTKKNNHKKRKNVQENLDKKAKEELSAVPKKVNRIVKHKVKVFTKKITAEVSRKLEGKPKQRLDKKSPIVMGEKKLRPSKVRRQEKRRNSVGLSLKSFLGFDRITYDDVSFKFFKGDNLQKVIVRKPFVFEFLYSLPLTDVVKFIGSIDRSSVLYGILNKKIRKAGLQDDSQNEKKKSLVR